MVDLSWFRRRQTAGPTPYDKPARERHILSVVCSCLSVLLVILSLSLQEWGKARTERCKFTFKLTQVVLEDEGNEEDYTYSSEWISTSVVFRAPRSVRLCVSSFEFSSSSDGVLHEQPADSHFVCHQCVSPSHRLFPHCHHNQLRLPTGKTRIPPTLCSLQHHIMYVMYVNH